MNNRIARFLFVLCLFAVILSACGGSSTSTDADESASVDSSTAVDSPTVTAQVEATEAPAEEEKASVEATEAAEDTEEEITEETVAMDVTYPIVDTGQGTCYDNSELIDCPAEGEAFYGQDAQYTGNEPSYTDNGDGTSPTTSPVWCGHRSCQTHPCPGLTRRATANPLRSAASPTGDCPTSRNCGRSETSRPVGPGSIPTTSISLAMALRARNSIRGRATTTWSIPKKRFKNVAFIVNDWTGHIKALDGNRFVRCVSGDEYGINDFVDNGDGTITDNATGLMWAQDDSGEAMDWEAALAYAEDVHRMPAMTIGVCPMSKNCRALPITRVSSRPLIQPCSISQGSPMKQAMPTIRITGQAPPIPTSTRTMRTATGTPGIVAAGYAVDHEGNDTHGAGAVRFDTKTVDAPSGPDPERGENYVRLVRGGDVVETPDGDPSAYRTDRVVVFEDGDTGDIGVGGPGGLIVRKMDRRTRSRWPADAGHCRCCRTAWRERRGTDRRAWRPDPGPTRLRRGSRSAGRDGRGAVGGAWWT